MNYVADAHTIIWYFIDDPRLSQTARQAFEQTITAGVIIIPTIVLAEIMYISQKGRISMTFEETLSHIETYENFRIATLDLDILRVAANVGGDLEMHDKLIVATTLYFDAHLITKDEHITQSGVVNLVNLVNAFNDR